MVVGGAGYTIPQVPRGLEAPRVFTRDFTAHALRPGTGSVALTLFPPRST